ncbi:hypothetical protein GCM10011512_12860 [Tersicoccus solisilvae]|uniref:Uncharacterized protein n=1 Tax=Tersicoccus solisilvae TaxID=1882339 RepID=A0ABQ1NYI6_9MICC|nr:hypothetical protein [Tersicoccus solisilvae]GGC87347.1 hypothetical protein GCM10011512_12860 [Tersicoccus solisilvae]
MLAHERRLIAMAKGGVILREPVVEVAKAHGRVPVAAVALALLVYPHAQLAAAGAAALGRRLD